MNRSCGVCGGIEREILFQQKFIIPDEISLADQYDIVRCSECGFIFADTASSQEDYDAYYALLSKYENAETVYSELTETISREKEYSAKIIDGLYLPKESRIVEIGCANGHLLSVLKEKGYSNLCGIDPSAVCVKNVSQKGIESQVGFLTNNHLTKGSCDLIILEGVLEHVRDVKGTIENLFSYLSEAGKLLIIVPDVDTYGMHYVAPHYYFDIEHINHFSYADMRHLGNHYGLRVVHHSTFDFDFPRNTKVSILSVVLEKDLSKKGLPYEPSDLGRRSVEEHIRSSQAALSAYEKIIERIGSVEPIVIYGAGNHTYRILANTKLHELNILAFIDNDQVKQNLTLLGKPILPSGMLQKLQSKVILCTAFSNEGIKRDIKNKHAELDIISIE